MHNYIHYYNDEEMTEYICHFNEISYFEIEYSGKQRYYYPVLKNGNRLCEIDSQNGKEYLNAFIDFKNK